MWWRRAALALNGMVGSQIKTGVAVLSQPTPRHQPLIRATTLHILVVRNEVPSLVHVTMATTICGSAAISDTDILGTTASACSFDKPGLSFNDMTAPRRVLSQSSSSDVISNIIVSRFQYLSGAKKSRKTNFATEPLRKRLPRRTTKSRRRTLVAETMIDAAHAVVWFDEAWGIDNRGDFQTGGSCHNQARDRRRAGNGRLKSNYGATP
jgi:hypothetical protein